MRNKGLELLGGKELERTLKTLGERVQRKVLRQSVNAAATPVLKAARKRARKRSGLMRKSLAKKVVTNKKSGAVDAIIGPRKGFQGEYEGEVQKPSRYAHLAHSGFIDQNGTYHPGDQFLNAAAGETQGQAIETMRSKLAAGVAREAKKRDAK